MKRSRFVSGVCAAAAAGPLAALGDDANATPIDLVANAILAANAHNTQPWRFKLTSNAIEVFPDFTRSLEASDPFDRELYLGLGCAVENILISGQAGGYATSLQISAGSLTNARTVSPGTPAARVDVRLRPGTASSTPLFDAIPKRHTNIFPFEIERRLPSDFVEAIGAFSTDVVHVFTFADRQARETVAEVLDDAARIMYKDPAVLTALRKWIHTSDQDSGSRDGNVVPPGPQLTPGERIQTVPLVGLICVKDRYDCVQTIAAGRIWERINLLATIHGIAARPENLTIQYIDWGIKNGETLDAEARLKALGNMSEWNPALVFCLGYPTAPSAPSERRPLEAVLISS